MARARCRDCGEYCVTDRERRALGFTDRLGWAYQPSLSKVELLLCDRCLPLAVYEATKDKAA